MYYLAVDIGASSGRHIVGYEKNGKIETEEVYRFKNGMDLVGDHLEWNVERLFTEVKNGIKIAIEKYGKIQSLAIDTWGVDYVLLKGDEEVLPCYAYRDGRTKASAEEVHKIIKFEDIYRRTGIEFHEFNSIYQLYSDKVLGRLDGVTDFLMIPEYLSYKLTGVKKKEYTNASTTALVNTLTHKFDGEIIKKLGLREEIFKDLYQPGEEVGSLKEEIQKEVGGDVKVVLCASHDTASAVCGIDMEENSPYISSGTWSLLGVKNEVAITNKSVNISNEGGVNNTFRYQKNIMGMWLINELQKNLDKPWTIVEMVENAKLSTYTETFDVNDESLVAPTNMKQAILNMLKKTAKAMPQNDGDIINSVYNSLAKCYAETLKEIEENTGKKYNKMYIVGGGAKNKHLNELTEKYTGIEIIGLPIEATSIGNLKIQMLKNN